MIIVYYDGWCPVCTKTALKIKSIGKNHGVRILSFRNTHAFKNVLLPTYIYEGIETKLIIFDHNNQTFHSELQAVEILCHAIPFLWIILPVIKIVRFLKKEDRFYTRLSERRGIIPVGTCHSSICHYHHFYKNPNTHT